MRTLLCVLVLVLLPTLTDAQTRVQNPTLLAFTPSTDHANINNYQVQIVSSAGAVIQTLDIGKPSPCAAGQACPPGVAVGECFVSIQVQPITFGSYTIVMRAVGGGIIGPASSPTEVWERAPGPPSKGRVQ